MRVAMVGPHHVVTFLGVTHGAGRCPQAQVAQASIESLMLELLRHVSLEEVACVWIKLISPISPSKPSPWPTEHHSRVNIDREVSAT